MGSRSGFSPADSGPPPLRFQHDEFLSEPGNPTYAMVAKSNPTFIQDSSLLLSCV